MVANLRAWEDPTTPLRPYIETDPKREVVRPRNVQLIPGYYATLLFNHRGISAKVAFQEIHYACPRRSQYVSRRTHLAQSSPHITRAWRASERCTRRLSSHRSSTLVTRSLLVYDRQSPVGPTSSGSSGGHDTTETHGALVGARRALAGKAEGTAGDRSTWELKTVAEVYKETYRTLLRFSNVSEVTELAPLWWGRLANCMRTQEFQQVCLARGLSAELYTPVVTNALNQMINGFQFVGHHGVDDLMTGCQPYLVVYSGSAHHQQALANISQQLAQGDHQNASLADYHTLREKRS